MCRRSAKEVRQAEETENFPSGFGARKEFAVTRSANSSDFMSWQKAVDCVRFK